MNFPETYYLTGNSLRSTAESYESIMEDPRGVIFMYHPPDNQAKYVMGMDPTLGITGWSRGNRTDGDHKVDNCAIEIFQPDAIREPVFNPDKSIKIDPLTGQQMWHYRDLQVCEFAAPIDAVEGARLANVLGRIFAGNEEDQCELIYESYPGPGMLSTQELLRLGYANLWMWEYIDSVAEETNRIGWRSSRESQKLLWNRSRRHLMKRNAIIRSKWLREEYQQAVVDVEKQRAKASYGYHDDRMQAANQVFWASHAWTYDVERTNEAVTTVPSVEWQKSAPVLGEHRSFRDQWSDAVEGWDAA